MNDLRSPSRAGTSPPRVLHGPSPASRETLIVLPCPSGDASPEALAWAGAALAARGLAAPEPLPAAWSDLAAALCAAILTRLALPAMPVRPTGRDDAIAFAAGAMPITLHCAAVAGRLLQQARAGGIAAEADEAWRQLLAAAEGMPPPPHFPAVAAACAELGVPCHHLAPGNEIQLGEGRHRILLDGTDTSATSLIASERAWDKLIANRLLAANGLPVARQIPAGSAAAAWQAALAIGPPVVVKPRRGHRARGVSLAVASAAEMEEAFAAAREVGQQVLVESLIPGRDYRVMVVRGRVTGVIMSQPPQVVGDGRQSIAALVDAFNHDRDRRAGTAISPIPLGPEAAAMLRAAGRDFDSVPAAGETVVLHRIAGTRRGGIPVDVTETIHPRTAAMLVHAAAIIGLDVAGIDYRTPDIRRPWHETGGGICEVNSGSGLRVMGIRPHWIRDGLIAPLIAGRALRMRHVAVIGDDAARPALDALARDLARGLERRGWHLGLALSDGLWLDRYRAGTAPLAPFDAHRRAIENPLLDAAIHVVTPGIVTAHGFGLSRLDLALLPAGAAPVPRLRGFCIDAGAEMVEAVTPDDLDRLAARLVAAPPLSPPAPTSPG